MALLVRSIAIGCTVFLDMRLLVPGIGLAGMVLQQNNFVLVDFCTMKTLIRATGPKMLMDVKNTVSIRKK